MDIAKIVHILFQIFGLGCIFAIIFFMCKIIEEKIPEPFKQLMVWVRVFILLLCCAFAIYFIIDIFDINMNLHTHDGHIGRF